MRRLQTTQPSFQHMTVTYLERRREGNLGLGDLPRGAVRELTQQEIGALLEAL